MKEIFLATVINRSVDFKLPPQICIISLEKLSTIGITMVKNPLAVPVHHEESLQLCCTILLCICTVGKEFKNT